MANEEALSMIEEAIAQYKPGGAFATSRGQQLAQKKATIVPKMQADLSSRGLSGTTLGAAIPAQFEQEVATPWNTETDLLRSQNLMQAILAKAGFAERASAQQQEKELAQAQMALQEKLANKQISMEEYKNATARLAAMGGGGGGGGGRGEFDSWGSKSTFGEVAAGVAGGETTRPTIDYGSEDLTGYEITRAGAPWEPFTGSFESQGAPIPEVYKGGSIAGMTPEQTAAKIAERNANKLKSFMEIMKNSTPGYMAAIGR